MSPSVSCLSLWLHGVLVVALFGAAPSSFAAETSKQRHAAILARALSYELTLEQRAGPSVGIAVVYDPGNAASEANADEWLYAVKGLSLCTEIEGP